MEWVSDCIAAGVDGVDVRISCHSSWTDSPQIYGFNPPVAAEYERRYGVNPDVEPYDPALLGNVRGDLYDRFLRAARTRLAAAGLPMHHHIEIESFRPDRLAFAHAFPSRQHHFPLAPLAANRPSPTRRPYLAANGRPNASSTMPSCTMCWMK